MGEVFALNLGDLFSEIGSINLRSKPASYSFTFESSLVSWLKIIILKMGHSRTLFLLIDQLKLNLGRMRTYVPCCWKQPLYQVAAQI